jgi:hypothetical protein
MTAAAVAAAASAAAIVFLLGFDAVQLQQPTSIFVSHDWPNLITRYGNSNWLFSKKPYFQKEVRSTQSSTAMVCMDNAFSMFAC